MADNVAITAGSGTNVATDDVSSVHFQKVKIDVGGDGVSAPLSTSNPIPVSDSGGSLTVDGTVAISGTVAVTDNSGSLTVDAPVGTPAFVRLSDGSAAITTLPVSLASVPSHAVTNAGTFASQENGAALTALQLIDDAVYTDDTSTHATGTSKGLLIMAAATPTDTAVNANDIGAVAMTLNREMLVSVNTALPAGTNAIGKLAANSGIDIGDVDITSVVPGTAATSLGKAEDAAHTSGDTGVMTLAVRRDANTTLADTTGDYAPLQVDATGNLKVAIISGAGSGGTSIADEAAFTMATTSVNPIGAVYNSSPDTLTTGKAGALQMTAARGLHVHIVDAAGASTTIGNDYTHDAALTPASTAGPAVIWRGSSSAPSAVSAGDDAVLGWADLSGRPQINISQYGGTTPPAHDAADAGPGQKITAKAETALSGVTLVADGDRTDLYAAADGVLITRNVCLEDVVQERTTNTDGASTAFASGLAAPGSGIRLWVKSVTICNSSASFCTVDLRDGSAGSVLWTLPVPATGGVTHVFDPPLKLTANTALAFDASAATSTLTISANGFKSKL